MYAMLLLGLVLMHHAPDDGRHGPVQNHGRHNHGALHHGAPDHGALLQAAPMTTAATGNLTTVAHIAAAEPEANLPSPHGGQPTHGLADLLHLCLATLAAAVALGVSLLLTMRRGPTAAPRPARRILDHLQPPPPVPRRLAALSVLRL